MPLTLSTPAKSLHTGAALLRTMAVPQRPDRMWRSAAGSLLCGSTLAGAVAASAARDGRQLALVDDDGPMTYGELWAGSDAVARHLRRNGHGPGTTIGVLARNHRTFVLALVAAAKSGADTVLLNTGFAGAQVEDVVALEDVDLLIHDDDLPSGARGGATLAAHDVLALAADPGRWPLRPARRQGRLVILTSGTTGRPKGTARRSRASAALQVLRVLPLRMCDDVVIAAPAFHSWGLGHLTLGLGLSSTVHLTRGFDPERTLAGLAASTAQGLVVVPVMLQRIVELGGSTLARYDTSSLRYIAVSGSAMPAELTVEVLRRFGPVLYNAYGSTEASLATVASPQDLARSPGCAGRPVPGTTVRVLDEEGLDVPAGATGRIFVGSGSRFDGYTDGSTKDVVDGLVATGDLGSFDDRGCLHVVGRADDMIISGGENVYPQEVEELLAQHPDVREAAVVGVADQRFGQRLHAFVVRRDGGLTEAAVIEHVQSTLARHKAPRGVTFVDELPRTTTGKVRRQELLA